MNSDVMFGSTMFGFDKSDVNAYIEKMVKEFELRIREKDEEINLLRLQNKELKDKIEYLSKNSNNFSSDKNKIIEVLMKAQEKADSIVEDAREKHQSEIKLLDDKLEKEKQKINQEIDTERKKVGKIKNELQILKKDSMKTIERFHREVDNIFEELTTENECISDTLISSI